MTPLVSVIVVTYRSSATIGACLEALDRARRTLPLEAIVVDNAPGDPTEALVRERFPWVRVVANGSNAGFTRAVNQGLGLARANALLLLNPDAVIEVESLARLLAALGERPDAGAVAPALEDARGRVQPSCGRFPNLWTLACEHLWLDRLAPSSRSFGGHRYGDRPLAALDDVDWASGAALLLRREAVERIGGLEERLFMFMEEVDWCRRARAAGYRVRYVPAARCTHEGQCSSRQVPGESYLHNVRSRVEYFRIHHGTAAAAAARAILVASFALKWAAAAVRHGIRPAGIYARAARTAAMAALVAAGLAAARPAPAASVRAAYFYHYLAPEHLDSLALAGFDRAVIHWIPDTLDAASARELAAFRARGAALGIEVVPEWVFQAPTRLAARPAARRYAWGEGEVEPSVPCPLDSAYWASALFERAEEFLAADPSLRRVAVDLEHFEGRRRHYDAGACRCASCVSEYARGTAGLDTSRPSRLAGLLAFEERALARRLVPQLEAFARRHPGVAIEVLDLDFDSFVHRALARALAKTGVPTADYCERSYSSGAAGLAGVRSRLRALGHGTTPVYGGLWLKRFAPAALAVALRDLRAACDGAFVFTTYSLAVDARELAGPYVLAGSARDTWTALAEGNR